MMSQSQVYTIMEKRRLITLERRKKNREDLIKASRMAFCNEEVHEEEIQIIDGGSLQILEQETISTLNNLKHQKIKPKKKKYKFAFSNISRKLQIPDYLVSIPNDFNRYLAYTRPAGRKVVIILKGDKVVVVSKSGMILSTFASNYITSHQRTVLQAIMMEQCDKTLFITDVIQWKGQLKVSDEAIFRYFWLNSNLPKTFTEKQKNPYQFVLLEIYQLNKQNFKKLYQQQPGFKKDGIVFVHKQSIYQAGINPQVLYWKDKNTSQYYESKNPLTAIATIRDDCLYTVDNQVISRLPSGNCENYKKFRQAKLQYSKIQIEEGEINGINEDNLKVCLQGVKIVELFQRAKQTSDSLSKLLFQSNMLTNPITAEVIFNSLN